MRQRQRPQSATAKLLLFVVAVAALYGSYYLGTRHAPRAPRFLNFTELEKPRPIEDLALRDQYGNPFTERRLIGNWNLVIAGYTGAAEPLMDRLTLITYAKNRLADHPDLQQITRGLFITVDPDTDTPEVLNAFMARFSPDYLALTGSAEAIDSTGRALGFIVSRSRMAEPKDYRIEHSSSIALIDPDANFIGLFTGALDAASIAADITRLATTKPQ